MNKYNKINWQNNEKQCQIDDRNEKKKPEQDEQENKQNKPK